MSSQIRAPRRTELRRELVTRRAERAKTLPVTNAELVRRWAWCVTQAYGRRLDGGEYSAIAETRKAQLDSDGRSADPVFENLSAEVERHAGAL